MKTANLVLLFVLILPVYLFSQGTNNYVPMHDSLGYNIPVNAKKYTHKHLKAYEDTMAYFDFNASLPLGWSVYNNSSNSYDWIWSDQAPRGQFTSEPAINSTSGANGFMVLEGDHYNTPIGTGATAMNAFFQSNAIPIDSVGSVFIRFQQSFRFCCSGSTIMDLSVSTDGSTWTDFDVKGSTGTNVSSANPKMTEINVSSVAAHEDTIYIRFHKAIASHYYWMIDDVAIIEGVTNDLMQESMNTQYKGINFSMHNNPNNFSWQFYKQIPLELASPMYVQSNYNNNGGADANMVNVSYSITQDMDCYGMPGNSSFNHSESINIGTISSNTRDTVTFNTPFVPQRKGLYTLTTNISSPATDQLPNNNSVSHSFIISDTIYAKDDGTAEANIGSNNHFVGDTSGLLLYYRLDTPAVLTSLSYFIANSSQVDSTSFTAQVYEYNEYDSTCINLTDSGCFSVNPIAASSPKLVDSTMRGTWVTIPLNFPIVLDSGGYVIGYSTPNNSSTQNFMVGRDYDADRYGPYNTQYIYDKHAFIYSNTQGIGLIDATPMMRMNFGQLSLRCFTGIKEQFANIGFSVLPNPSSGELIIEISSLERKEYDLHITNTLGQIVYNEVIIVNDQLNKKIDLTKMDKGVYFVTLENEIAKETKKIILQ